MNEDFNQRAAPSAVLRTPLQAPAVDRTAAAPKAAGMENGSGVEADFLQFLAPLAMKAVGALLK
ncbi:hypothetical protein PGH47_43070 (plasmid) [Streptomyces sp. HUAS 31]|uniref:hypothetical protein n=1 Tax=Streptomyces sp. HUAS 31 TaxID=3020055 RepID=UPI0023067B89|nr:hypothetical protein [Streptomyces sp. HUAS 31]WCE02528.1 hypothetical protein PGH47_43070 [Streptomyces sp. HUAS 31]